MPLCLLALALAGALAGHLLMARLSTGSYRYEDERGAPVPRPAWIVPTLAGLWPALAAAHWGRWALVALLLACAVVGCALAAMDLDVHRLPDAVQLPAAPALVVAATLVGLLEGDPGRAGRAVLAGAALGAAHLALALLAGGALGLGDVKLAVLIGLALGLLGWPQVLWGSVLAWVMGGLAALALLLTRRVGRSDPIPFGPAMLAGAAAAALLPL